MSAGSRTAATVVAPAVLASAVSAGAARLAYAVLRRTPPGGGKTWSRTNHRGEPVTLLEGPAVTAGALAALGISKAVQKLSPERPAPSAPVAPFALAGAAAAAFGLYDDLAGSGKRRGLRGHLGALAHGEVTTGAVKLIGIAATGAAAAILLPGRRNPGDVLVNAGLIAGGANLLNLFDLRPGRAIKVAVAAGTGLRAAAAATGGGNHGAFGIDSSLGSALALLPEDLGERAMLGDCGANALGALLGTAAAASLPRTARIGALAGIVALTAASEKISFTKVIERTPPLRWLDLLGRRPPAVPAPVPPADPAPPAERARPQP